MSPERQFRRFRMEMNLREWTFVEPKLPDGYHAEPWRSSLLDAHAAAHYLSFRDEIDATMFTRFQTYGGCRQIVENVSRHCGFLPDATWLMMYHPKDAYYPEAVGTMQALIDTQGLGSIQNIGVIPAHRGKGLGGSLLMYCLRGYRSHGVSLVHLDVTAENGDAIQLYKKIGFQIVSEFYYVQKSARN